MSAHVAFVIPTYNDDPGHLREAVESATAQEDAAVEVVVVNDGSTSRATLTALDSLPTGVMRIDQDNRGPSAARNAGIRATTAPFVIPLDGDDRVDKRFAARGIDQLAADRACRFAYGSVELFGADRGCKVPPPQVALVDLAGGNCIAATAVFRRADWESVGGYDEQLRRGFEDYEFWVRLLAQLGGVGRRTESVLGYRQKTASRRLADLGEGLARTRGRILNNNPDHLDVLLTAAWARLDTAAGETQKAWDDPLQMRRYLRPLKRLRRH